MMIEEKENSSSIKPSLSKIEICALLNQNERKCYERFFSHFALRLSERYDILISFEEYVLLSKLPYIQKPKMVKDKKGNPDHKVGWLTIKEKKVKVLKSVKTNKPLLTALPVSKKERTTQNIPVTVIN